jgi:hypothetical protein
MVNVQAFVGAAKAAALFVSLATPGLTFTPIRWITVREVHPLGIPIKATRSIYDDGRIAP